ncbi:MAG: cellulase family glycosylhydrolase, partial [Acidimicrobiales bacterium]|nr:cellulase family glycosylhydrolase [Acidimicrobiales bacterium]
PPNDGRCAAGEFAIDENRAGIRDTDGSWFLPKGINLAAGRHFDGAFFENNSADQITAADVAVLRDDWQFNSIRLNVNSQAGPQVFDDAVVHRVIGLFTDAGMVVMITDHNLTGQDPTPAQRQAQANRFGAMAERYADNPCVWFNPYNEPGGSPTSTYNYTDGDVTDDDAWIDWHVPVIDAIRAESDAVVVLNESHWGQGRAQGAYTPSHSTVLTYGQQVNQMYDNIMYTVHFYERWDGRTQDIQSYLQSANNKGLAIAVGEIGGHHTLGGSRPTSRWTTVQAVYNLAPAGVGLYAWHADARHSSGMAMGPHPNGGAGRTLAWEITQRSQTDATGTKQWDWNHNPPAPVPS